MTMIQLIACIGMIAGLFMVLHVSPRELSDSLFSCLTAAPGSIRADINETTKRKRQGTSGVRSPRRRRSWQPPDGQTGSPWCASHLCSALHWEPALPLPLETLSLCRCWLLV